MDELEELRQFKAMAEIVIAKLRTKLADEEFHRLQAEAREQINSHRVQELEELLTDPTA